MGIKNLRTLINKFAPDAISTKHLKTYENQIITIDTSLYMYRMKYNNKEKYLEGFIKQVLRLIRNKITPVYIFDGAPPPEKTCVLQSRKDTKETLQERIKEVEEIIQKAVLDETILNDLSLYRVKIDNGKEITERPCTLKDLEEEYNKLNKRNINVSYYDFKILKKLLRRLGVPYIVANGEAETLCAKLSRCGLVGGCMSEDMDILPNGGKKFIRNFNSSKNTITEYDLDIILEKMEITYEQFIDICILCGCDYCPKITGIGPINAYKLIKKHKDIETLLGHLKPKNKVPEDFEYEKARHLFLCDYDEIECLTEQMVLKPANFEKLNKFMNDYMVHKINDKTMKQMMKLLEWQKEEELHNSTE